MQPPPSRLVGPALGLVTAAAAASAAYVAFARYTPLNSLLFMEYGLDERSARWADLLASGGLVVAALGALTGLRSAVRVAGLAVALWFAALALCTAALGGAPFAHLAPVAHAARFGLPLALVSWTFGRWGWSAAVLRVALATTFAVHGYEALQHPAVFVDLLLMTSQRAEGLLGLGRLPFGEVEARTLLTAIGVLDLLLAALVVCTRLRVVALYMALWGAVTALSRLAVGGLEWWPEVGLRLSHVGGPLVLALLWSRRSDLAEVPTGAPPESPGEPSADPQPSRS